MQTVRLLVLLGFMAIPAAASAQGFRDAGIGIFGGVSVPTGDFADDDGADAGNAELGFMVGADAYLPLGTTEFGWITSASLNSFGFDDDGDETVDLGRYWLFPVMTGVSYAIEVGPSLLLTPLAQIGLNLAFGPNGEIGDLDVETGTSLSLAASVGANLDFSETLGVTLRYVNGGEPERDVEIEQFPDDEVNNPMAFVQIGVVYTLR